MPAKPVFVGQSSESRFTSSGQGYVRVHAISEDSLVVGLGLRRRVDLLHSKQVRLTQSTSVGGKVLVQVKAQRHRRYVCNFFCTWVQPQSSHAFVGKMRGRCDLELFTGVNCS